MPDMDKGMIDEGKRVALLVEDDTTLVSFILDALARNNFAHKVVQTHDRVEALDYLLGRGDYKGRDPSSMPCLILLDASLPSGDSLEVLREIRTHKQTQLLPVVVFSSSEEQDETNECYYTLGANSYIGKTCEYKPLVETLRQAAEYWCVLNEPPPAL
jgi:two-component system, response regulator